MSQLSTNKRKSNVCRTWPISVKCYRIRMRCIMLSWKTFKNFLIWSLRIFSDLYQSSRRARCQVSSEWKRKTRFLTQLGHIFSPYTNYFINWFSTISVMSNPSKFSSPMVSSKNFYNFLILRSQGRESTSKIFFTGSMPNSFQGEKWSEGQWTTTSIPWSINVSSSTVFQSFWTSMPVLSVDSLYLWEKSMCYFSKMSSFHYIRCRPVNFTMSSYWDARCCFCQKIQVWRFSW